MKAAFLSTVINRCCNNDIRKVSIRELDCVGWELGVPGDSHVFQRRILGPSTGSWAPDVHNTEQKEKEQEIWDQKAWAGGLMITSRLWLCDIHFS